MHIEVPVNQAEALRRGLDAKNSSARIQIDPSKLTGVERECIADHLVDGFRLKLPDGIGCSAPTFEGLREALRYTLRSPDAAEFPLAGFVDDIAVMVDGSVCAGFACMAPGVRSIDPEFDKARLSVFEHIIDLIPPGYSLQVRSVADNRIEPSVSNTLSSPLHAAPLVSQVLSEQREDWLREYGSWKLRNVRLLVFVIAEPSAKVKEEVKLVADRITPAVESIATVREDAESLARFMHGCYGLLAEAQLRPKYLKQNDYLLECWRYVCPNQEVPTGLSLDLLRKKANAIIRVGKVSGKKERMMQGILQSDDNFHAILSLREGPESCPTRLWDHLHNDVHYLDVVASVRQRGPGKFSWSASIAIHVRANTIPELEHRLLHLMNESERVFLNDGVSRFRFARETVGVRDAWFGTMPGMVGEYCHRREIPIEGGSYLPLYADRTDVTARCSTVALVPSHLGVLRNLFPDSSNAQKLLIAGASGAGKTMLIHHLLIQVARSNPHVICVSERCSCYKRLIQAIGGNESIKAESLPPYNPVEFCMEFDERVAAVEFVGCLIGSREEGKSSDGRTLHTEEERILMVGLKAISLTPSDKNLRALARWIEMQDSAIANDLYKKLTLWCDDGRLAALLNSQAQVWRSAQWSEIVMPGSIGEQEDLYAELELVRFSILIQAFNQLKARPVQEQRWLVWDADISGFVKLPQIKVQFIGLLRKFAREGIRLILSQQETAWMRFAPEIMGLFDDVLMMRNNSEFPTLGRQIDTQGLRMGEMYHLTCTPKLRLSDKLHVQPTPMLYALATSTRKDVEKIAELLEMFDEFGAAMREFARDYPRGVSWKRAEMTPSEKMPTTCFPEAESST